MNREKALALMLGTAFVLVGCSGTEQGEPRAESSTRTTAGTTAQQQSTALPQDGDRPVSSQPTVGPGGDETAREADLEATGRVPAASAGAAQISPPNPGAGVSSASPGSASPAPATATAPDAAAVLGRAEEVYSSVRSMEADFTQVVDVPLLGQSTRSAGKLYHRSPDRFKMRFSQPAGDVVVADGRHLWMYYPSVDERQVMRTTMAATGGQVDLHREFLSNPTQRYNAVLSGTETVDGRLTDIVVLTPRTPSGYRQVRLWIDRDDALVRRFEITEENESVRTLSLRNIRRNPTLGDDVFRFTPPEGAQIFDQ